MPGLHPFVSEIEGDLRFIAVSLVEVLQRGPHADRCAADAIVGTSSTDISSTALHTPVYIPHLSLFRKVVILLTDAINGPGSIVERGVL